MSLISTNKIGLSDCEITNILSFTQRFPDIDKIILFGSRAKGSHKNGSDVDIAISGTGVNYSIVNKLSYLLNEESLLPYYFDVLNLAEIDSEALLSHIEEFGIELNFRV